MHRLQLDISLFLFLILFDQLFKYLVRFYGGFYICNQGISFGIQLPANLFWLVWSTLISFLVFLYYKKATDKEEALAILQKFSLIKHCFRIGIIFVISGAIANIIDRIFLGCVLDFISMFSLPIFNLADAFIFLGVIMIIIKTFEKNLTLFLNK